VSGLEHALRPDLVSRMVVSGMLDHPAGAPSSTPEDLLALQLSVDGSWRPSPEAEQVTGISMDRIRELAEGLEVPEAEALVVTLAVLVTLEARHPEAPALWRPLLRKARNWVERTVAGGSPPSEADWEAWMQTQLGL
jgi:hypothetical protein